VSETFSTLVSPFEHKSKGEAIMTNLAVVFPGQGSQRMGMAMDFYDQFQVARDIFSRASDYLALDIEKICREPDPRLNLTEFTQPCLLTAEIAMWETLKSEFGLIANYYGGHSCGEFTALVASGTLPLEPALRLVHIRGKLMQFAAPVHFGGMIAVTNTEKDLPRKKILALAALGLGEAKVNRASSKVHREFSPLLLPLMQKRTTGLVRTLSAWVYRAD
jgi:malonyl CoA-acyl carrier protein transacylase